MKNVCEHGQLKRQCPHCENNELILENESLKSRIAEIIENYGSDCHCKYCNKIRAELPKYKLKENTAHTIKSE